MDAVPFMTNCKSAGFFVMTKLQHFIQGINAYTGSNPLYDIQFTKYYIIYLDSSNLFPPPGYSIDCLDFSLIHLQQQKGTTKLVRLSTSTNQVSTSTNQGGNTGQSGNQ